MHEKVSLGRASAFHDLKHELQNQQIFLAHFSDHQVVLAEYNFPFLNSEL